MTGAEIALVVVAAFFAGAMNAIAGGGTFLSFPALLAVGVPPVVANASNAVALWPASLSSAFALRRELKRHRAILPALSLAALVGGATGGLLLLATSDNTFSTLIPWLLLTATALFAASGRISAWLAARRTRPQEADTRTPATRRSTTPRRPRATRGARRTATGR